MGLTIIYVYILKTMEQFTMLGCPPESFPNWVIFWKKNNWEKLSRYSFLTCGLFLMCAHTELNMSKTRETKKTKATILNTNLRRINSQERVSVNEVCTCGNEGFFSSLTIVWCVTIFFHWFFKTLPYFERIRMVHGNSMLC